MMGGPGRFGDILNQETLKPRSLGSTLRRLGAYFGRFWPGLVFALILIITATWTQVTTPDLMGQATDCFLVGLGASGAGGAAGSFFGMQSSNSAANCWIVQDPGTQPGARWVLSSAYRVGGFVPPALETLDTAGRMAGLARLIGIIVALFVLGALATGMTFFAMAWAGQHVLRALRIDVFERLHQLSLSFYAATEAGDLMSRITNDTGAIEQAISFALVNVLSAVLGLTWVAYYMISASPALALLALAVTPLMFLATLYFSSQARKAFRLSRREIGNVNAELQESIAAVREVQAFSRADENIEQFKEVNAANRDANVRAVTFTSALSPTLEALGYVGLAIVAGVGGLYLLTRHTAIGHHGHIRPGGDLPGLRVALQPAHPTDRRAVDQHPERNRGR